MADTGTVKWLTRQAMALSAVKMARRFRAFSRFRLRLPQPARRPNVQFDVTKAPRAGKRRTSKRLRPRFRSDNLKCPYPKDSGIFVSRPRGMSPGSNFNGVQSVCDLVRAHSIFVPPVFQQKGGRERFPSR